MTDDISIDRRSFLGGAAAAALALPLASGAHAASTGWNADETVRALPGGFDIGGGPNAGVGRSIQGPVWLPAENGIVFSDSGLARRLIWSPDKGYRLLHDKTNVALGTALDGEGRFVQCEWQTGTLARIDATGARTVLADGFGDGKFNHLVDLAIAADGTIFFADQRLWFGVLKPGTQPASGIYALAPGGQVTRVIEDIAQPGGIALSPDGRTLYLSDKANQVVRSYAVQGTTLSAGKRFASLKTDGWMAGPQGMTTDADGNLYVGGPGGVWVFAPDGRKIDLIALKTSRVTNLAFGGADMRTLFITSAVGVGYVRIARKGRIAAPAILHKTVSAPALTLAQGIERHDPELDTIIAPGTKIRNLVSTDFLNDLGGGEHDLYGRSLEGSFWYHGQNCLLFSDIGNNRRMRWTEGKGLSFEHAPTGYTNGANFDHDGHIISCEQGPEHRLTRRMKDGTRVSIADNYNGTRFCHPNDVAIHSNGSFYMTDPWWDAGEGIARPQLPAVYRISPDGARVEKLFDDFRLPNGIAFSPDERILYVADSYAHMIYAFPVAADGTVDVKARREFCFVGGPRAGTPDGISVDGAGNVYVGGEGGLWIINRQGKHLGTVVHGGTQTNNMTFGGPDGKMLYMDSWVALTAFPVLVAGKPIGKKG